MQVSRTKTVHEFHIYPENWIIEKDKDQLNWVRSYLTKCDWIEKWMDMGDWGNRDYMNMDYPELIYILNNVCEQSLGYVEITQMKSAWSQKKYRSKLKSKEKKAYNFVMSIDVKNQLRKVAKHLELPTNKAIEQLIKNEYDNLFKITRKTAFPEPDNMQTSVNYQNTPSTTQSDRIITDTAFYFPTTEIPEVCKNKFSDALTDAFVRGEAKCQKEEEKQKRFKESLKNLSYEKGSATPDKKQKIRNINKRIQKNKPNQY